MSRLELDPEDWGYIRLLYAIKSEKAPDVAISYVDKNRDKILDKLFPQRDVEVKLLSKFE